MSKEDEDFQKRIYQLHPHGNSYCITIPKPLVTEVMIKNGVYIEVVSVTSMGDIMLKLVVADEHREHTKDSKADRSDPQKSRTADSIQ